MKINKKRFFLIAMLLALSFNRAHSTIASIGLTPANPTTLSNGLSYYLAGITYSFTVNVIDPDISGWAQLTDVRLTITNATNIVIFINPSGTGTNLPVTVTSGIVNAVADISGTYNNCTVTFKVTFRWDTPESAFGAKTIIGSATTTYPANNTKTDSRSVNYGVCSSFQILNFAQDGVAADGMINPWHDSFNITGVPVYNVPGATLSDSIETIYSGEITNTLLYRSGNNTGFNDNSPSDISYTIPPQYFNNNSLPLGNHTWRIYAAMQTAPGFEYSSNTLSINCDEVEVTSIEFINGGGISNPPLHYYYRSVTQPGTQVSITARMRNGLGPMVGNVTFILENITNPNDDATIVIAHGQTTGIANLNFPNPLPSAHTTQSNTYRIKQISGGTYGGDDIINGNGQNVASRIQQPVNPIIYWDNEDPPGSGTPFTAWIGHSATADSLTLNWQPLANADPDRDFYSYKVYYKQTTETQYKIIDRSTSGYASLSNPTTGSVTITGLIPLKNYDIYITAIDVFGNEVQIADALPPVGQRTLGTLASTIRIQLTDGITTYDDDSFATFDQPNLRPVRKTNLRVKVFIISAYNLPDTVNILVRPYPGTDFLSGGVLQGVEGIDYYRFSTIKTASNEWTGYIQEQIPWMNGNSIKFIIETILNNVHTYSDYNSESETPATANPDDQPFTVSIQTPTQFTPWPTRILNNVIDDNHPYAYPAYYLTDDAYVTITVYDIKGRPVSKILDTAFRKGGQNIKENGWAGVNKANKKLGVGLYYIHIYAKRAS
ncbi:MAG: fibronectin type III domain-containing protein, partial [Spirochaetes bacterium]|nr:fibronectin type III domain-containing protein [Spirochaetota bacterium]